MPKGKGTYGSKKGRPPKKGTKKGVPADKQAKEPPRTKLQRSIAEMKHMKQLGEKDPERLANLFVSMFREAQQKEERDKQRFDEMIWDIVRKSEQPDEPAAEGESPARPK